MKIMITDARSSKDVLAALCVQRDAWRAAFSERLGISDFDLEYALPLTSNRVERLWAELNTYNRLFIARILCSDQVVGFAAAKLDDKVCLLRELDVDPKWWRQGIGTRLVREVFDWLDGTTPIQLEVETNNTRAIEMYHKLGFSIVCKKQEGTRIGTVTIHTFIMSTDSKYRLSNVFQNEL